MTRHFVLTGGGTAGHLFPGLAVAEAICSTDVSARITFASGGRPGEREAVERQGFEYLQLDCRPLPRRLWAIPRFVTANLAGFWQSQRFLQQNQVAAVVGLGGFASAPMARAALRCKVPLVLLEQNACPGRVTRWLAPSADLVCTAIQQSLSRLRSPDNVVVTGNPIRRSIAMLADLPMTTQNETASSAHLKKRTDEPLLLVLGGSGGARWLNQQMPASLAEMKRLAKRWKIVHQTGHHDAEATRSRYRSVAIQADVIPFIDDIANVLSRADLVVCRAGGTTLAELSVAGVPAITVPYPHAADDHQRHNAWAYQSLGACEIVQQSQASTGHSLSLVGQLRRLLVDDRSRATMSASARQASRPRAAEDVARRIDQLVAKSNVGLKSKKPIPQPIA